MRFIPPTFIFFIQNTEYTKAEDMKHICKKGTATNTLYIKLKGYLKSK